MIRTKQISHDILDEIGVFKRKDASEFKIHSWKIKAKALEKTNVVESNRLLAIIAVYENKYTIANGYFDKANKLSGSNDSNIFKDYGQALLMQGKGIEGIEKLLQAFFLEPDSHMIDKIINLSKTFLDIDSMYKLDNYVKKYNFNLDKYYDEIAEMSALIENRKNFLNNINVSVETYRAMINVSSLVLFKKFYSQAIFQINEYENGLNTIIYPESLNLDDISEINDDFVDLIVSLDLPVDDLMKLPFYFSVATEEDLVVS